MNKVLKALEILKNREWVNIDHYKSLCEFIEISFNEMKERYIKALKENTRELEYYECQWKAHEQEIFWFLQMNYYKGRIEIIEETLKWLD